MLASQGRFHGSPSNLQLTKERPRNLTSKCLGTRLASTSRMFSAILAIHHDNRLHRIILVTKASAMHVFLEGGNSPARMVRNAGRFGCTFYCQRIQFSIFHPFFEHFSRYSLLLSRRFMR